MVCELQYKYLKERQKSFEFCDKLQQFERVSQKLISIQPREKKRYQSIQSPD